MDSALSVVQNLEKDLQEIKAAARDGKLKPLPGETVSSLIKRPRSNPEHLSSADTRMKRARATVRVFTPLSMVEKQRNETLVPVPELQQ